MAREQKISNDRPIVVYDANRKKALGIFRQQSFVIKYLFSLDKRPRSISHVLHRKGRICNSDLNTKIVLRWANDEQIKQLGNEDVVMFDESLKKFDFKMIKGFDSTRGDYYAAHVIKKYGKTFK